MMGGAFPAMSGRNPQLCSEASNHPTPQLWQLEGIRVLEKEKLPVAVAPFIPALRSGALGQVLSRCPMSADGWSTAIGLS